MRNVCDNNVASRFICALKLSFLDETPINENDEKPVKLTVFANPKGEAISPFLRNIEIATSLRSSQRDPLNTFSAFS
jgi:hypothetical protein